MNILDTILNSKNGGAVDEISKRLGLDSAQTTSALGKLLPAVAGGLSKNASTKNGMGALMAALTKGGHRRYVDNPASATEPEAIADGNNILGHVFGSKDVSRQVAGEAAEQTGISAETLKKMLPMAATLAMGALSKKTSSAGSNGLESLLGLAGGQPQTRQLSGLAAILDQDKDGSVADDVAGFAKRLF